MEPGVAISACFSKTFLRLIVFFLYSPWFIFFVPSDKVRILELCHIVLTERFRGALTHQANSYFGKVSFTYLVGRVTMPRYPMSRLVVLLKLSG